MNVFVCEYCGKEHDGTYGSGRFCSTKCRGAFTAKMPRKHKRNEPKKCPYCGETVFGRNALSRHKHEKHLDMIEGGKAWNKGKTKYTDPRVAKASQTFKEHIKDGSITLWWTGKTHKDESKKKLSDSMKKAHAEGRAHNIGQSRWNNEPSYPEKWFMGVIENEFDDKLYVREFPFGRYSLDFAWVDKKKCIEIDGEQHQRFPEYKKRDMEKDALLCNNGWKVLRLPWKEVFSDPKKWINIAREFVDKDP